MELFHSHPERRVLVCAPSDAAADVICLRLSKYFAPKELFRLNWWQRIHASIALPLLPHCCLSDNNWFDIPISVSKIRSCKIIVCMCATAGILRNFQYFGNFGFDAVIIDEASQATEGETLVPLSLCKPSGIMVIAGDPKQLGPHPRSPMFEIAGT